jgi:hypothetical protein
MDAAALGLKRIYEQQFVWTRRSIGNEFTTPKHPIK